MSGMGFPYSASWPSYSSLIPEKVIRQILADQQATRDQAEALKAAGFLAPALVGQRDRIGVTSATWTCMYSLYDSLFQMQPQRTGRLYFDDELRLVAIEEETPQYAIHAAAGPSSRLRLQLSSDEYLAG